MCSRATRRRHKNIPLIINQYFRAKYTQINCVPFQVIQVKHQAVGRRRENKNAVALDSEQVTNLCFNTSTAFWRFGMKQPAALVSPGREATTGNTSAVRRLGMKQLTKIPSSLFFNPAPLQDPCRMHVQKILPTACVSLASKDHVFKSLISLLGLVASSESFTLQNL